MEIKEIAVFGLSGNPIHNGHVKIITELSLHYEIVYVWIVNNPDKVGKSDYIDLNIRIIMLEKVIKSLNLQNVFHTQQWSDCFTGTSIQKIHYVHPDAKLWIALGSDTLLTVPTWNGTDGLSHAEGFIEIKRYDVQSGLNSIVIDGKDLDVKTLLVSVPIISSTQIRKKIIDYNMDAIVDMIPPVVFSYINENNLYKN
jgi:nicotinate (nicotinamide) nucleotide adenylyltransferase